MCSRMRRHHDGGGLDGAQCLLKIGGRHVDGSTALPLFTEMVMGQQNGVQASMRGTTEVYRSRKAPVQCIRGKGRISSGCRGGPRIDRLKGLSAGSTVIGRCSSACGKGRRRAANAQHSPRPPKLGLSQIELLCDAGIRPQILNPNRAGQSAPQRPGPKAGVVQRRLFIDAIFLLNCTKDH